MLFLVLIVKCDFCKVIIRHRANLLSKHSKSRCHPSPIRRKSLFHLVICSFRVSSWDKKNLKRIFIPQARGYKTHNSFHNTSNGMKIHLRSYIYAPSLVRKTFLRMGLLQIFPLNFIFLIGIFLTVYTDCGVLFSIWMGLWHMAYLLPNHCSISTRFYLKFSQYLVWMYLL